MVNWNIKRNKKIIFLIMKIFIVIFAAHIFAGFYSKIALGNKFSLVKIIGKYPNVSAFCIIELKEQKIQYIDKQVTMIYLEKDSCNEKH
jgi:hypothetical protein